MPTATWNNQTIAIAPSSEVKIVENNVYFPASAVNTSYLQKSDTHTVCSWKGTASYYDVVVNGQTNKDAAWFYPEPKDAAKEISGYVAFWKGVKVDRDN